MNGYAKIALALLILAGGFGSGWIVKGWKDAGTMQALKTTNQKQIADMSKRDNDALNNYIESGKHIQAERDALAAKLAAQDAVHTKELNDAKHKEADFRACVASGKCGLRINATCPKPATVAGLSEALAGRSVDSGAAPRLDAGAQSGYFALRDGIPQYRATLAACQSALATITGQDRTTK